MFLAGLAASNPTIAKIEAGLLKVPPAIERLVGAAKDIEESEGVLVRGTAYQKKTLELSVKGAVREANPIWSGVKRQGTRGLIGDAAGMLGGAIGMLIIPDAGTDKCASIPCPKKPEK